MSYREHPVERQASIKHRVALSRGEQAANEKAWPTAGCHKERMQSIV